MSEALTASKRMLPDRPRLLVINNMPAFYRTPLFAELIKQFSAATGGDGMVAYQVRRDPLGRGEWFYTPDDELPFAHHFSSVEAKASSWRTGYPIRFDPDLWFGYRPTHIFAAGWDSPLSLAAATWARARGATFGTWVESNQSTSRRRSGPADLYRRLFLRSADFVVVPSDASRDYVQALTGRRMHTVKLLNSVALDRIADVPPATVPWRRIVFLGDLSRRKGFDLFQESARHLSPEGWAAVAWGRDTEGLGRMEPSVEVRESRLLRDIVPALHPRDILVIPSRSDPAPLTFSEGLALGLRVVISDAVAYAAEAPRLAGVEAAPAKDNESVADAVRRLHSAARPDVPASLEVAHTYFADHVVRALVSARQAPLSRGGSS